MPESPPLPPKVGKAQISTTLSDVKDVAPLLQIAGRLIKREEDFQQSQ